jgi:hypothetical protein
LTAKLWPWDGAKFFVEVTPTGAKAMFNRAVLLLCCLIGIYSVTESPATLRCKDKGRNYVSVQSSRRLESNGCSVPSFVKLADDAPDFTECCHLHDACYETCGETREYCDADFKTCMNSLCKRQGVGAGSCKETANMFFMGVSMFGTAGFEDSQRDWCTCAKGGADALSNHYTMLLADFYRQYTDRGSAAVLTGVEGDAVTEAGTEAEADPAAVIPVAVRQNITQFASGGRSGQVKFGRLYYRLHKKYGAAIKHVPKP